LLQLTTKILRFKEQGEKTGWTYILVPGSLASQLMPGNKKGFRVKGFLDDYAFGGISLMPMGDGNFILTLNAAVRKGIRKSRGAEVQVKMEIDTKPIMPPKELLECLADEPIAMGRFKILTKSPQNYFTNCINQAKTEPTKAKRIAASINSLAKGLGFGEALKSLRKHE